MKQEDLERWHRKSAAQLSDPSKLERARLVALEEIRKPLDEVSATESTCRRTRGLRRRRAKDPPGVKSSPSSSPNEGTASAEAWMCGVCGFVYSSKASCEAHEQVHVRNVVADLGYLAIDNPSPQTQLSPVDELWASNSEEELLGLDMDLSPPNIVREMSTEDFQHFDPLLSEPTRRLQTDSREPMLLGDGMDTVLFADRALVQVIKELAEPMMLTPEERDAEKALKWLSADADHYEALAVRAAERLENPTQRFRKPEEEAGALGKLQNKLLDTYQLLKESDSKRGLADCYNKSSQQSERGDGKSESLAPFAHLPRTIYVNVMVKNSVQVVRHELERLAKQRWDSRNGVELKPSSRFEKFRALTQTKAVKLAGLALSSDFTVGFLSPAELHKSQRFSILLLASPYCCAAFK